MLPEDPQAPNSEPEDDAAATRRLNDQDWEGQTLPADSAATRRLDANELPPLEPPADASATRRIDPDDLFSALKPDEDELPLPSGDLPIGALPTSGEPDPNTIAASFNLPDTPPSAADFKPTPPEPPRPAFTLPPTPEPPRSGAFTVPADAVSSAPPKKDNTAIIIASIAGCFVLLCCLCACITGVVVAMGAGGGF